MGDRAHNFIDITGQKFGRLTVQGRVETKAKRSRWSCICECGNQCVVLGSNLRSRHTTSCGCHKAEILSSGNNNRSHGKRHSREYEAWARMKFRCSDETNPYYGGKQIKVCERWKDSFENFLKDMGTAPTERPTIDRINPDRDYEPDNCRWASWREQHRNRTNNHKVSYNGEVLTVAEWAERAGLPYPTLSQRINRLGWDFERAITTPNTIRRKNADLHHQTH